jgi:hypothetical protein
MDPLRSASVAPVAAERHPLQPPSPPAEGADEAFAAADADFFLDWMASEHFFHGATPPLVAPPDAQLSGLPLLRALARQGAWRAVIERAKEVRHRAAAARPSHRAPLPRESTSATEGHPLARGAQALITPGLSRDLVGRALMPCTLCACATATAPDALRALQELSCVAYHAWALTKLRMYGSAADALRAAGDPDAAPNLDADGRSLAPFALLWLQARADKPVAARSGR